LGLPLHHAEHSAVRDDGSERETVLEAAAEPYRVHPDLHPDACRWEQNEWDASGDVRPDAMADAPCPERQRYHPHLADVDAGISADRE